jgi:hypothetical protein
MFSYATFEDEQSKQHAADLLSSPSAVLRQCVHDNVSPHRLRLQLLKVCLRAFAPRCAQIEPASGCVHHHPALKIQRKEGLGWADWLVSGACRSCPACQPLHRLRSVPLAQNTAAALRLSTLTPEIAT